MKPYIIGISAYYHDSAACLLSGDKIVAAAQEERFTRKKHDSDFPRESLKYCLKTADIQLQEVEAIVFYDKPLLKFDRLIETYVSFAPKGFKSFCTSMPVWIKEKLFLKANLKKELIKLAGLSKDELPPIFFTEHHQSHAASAFFPSPYSDATVLCMDGVGEWATTSAWKAKGNQLEPLWQINFPHSLGLLYSAFTYFLGFRVNSGEYKLMGLAPYGEPKYTEIIKNYLIDIKSDGSYRLDMSYFSFATGLHMINKKFEKLFNIKTRDPESEILQVHMDIASSAQRVTEEVILKLVKSLYLEAPSDNLCLAGGVALNCVANGLLQREAPFKNIWVQPAATDAGGALGAAYAYYHQYLGKEKDTQLSDKMQGGYLGPQFTDTEIQSCLDNYAAEYVKLNEDELIEKVCGELLEQKVVGWFDGRMEFGPRALGARSILADARSQEMQQNLNQKIKFRESFRPFAPIVLLEDVNTYYEYEGESPYMLSVAYIKEKYRVQDSKQSLKRGLAQLKQKRSVFPAVTHVDHTSRIQTVNSKANPRVHKLLTSFKEKTGCPLLVNTSFNVRGEPIVCTPEDALRCFMHTNMDCLVLGNYFLTKDQQAQLKLHKLGSLDNLKLD